MATTTSQRGIQVYNEVKSLLDWVDQRAGMTADHPLSVSDRRILDQVHYGLPVLRSIDIRLLRRVVASYGGHERCVLLGLLVDLVFRRQIGGNTASECRTLPERLAEALESPRLVEAYRRSYRQVSGK